MRIRTLVVLCLVALLVGGIATAADRPTYQKPPKVVSDILESPPTPAVSVAPSRDRLQTVHGVARARKRCGKSHRRVLDLRRVAVLLRRRAEDQIHLRQAVLPPVAIARGIDFAQLARP